MQNLPLHSPVGGSGMGRWHKNHCPGSVAAAVHYANLTSYEAEEGTAAHELAQTCLLTGLNAIDYHGHEFNNITVDDEMVVGVQSYIDFVRSIIKAYPGTEIHVEHKFHHPEVHKLFYGTIDTLLINRSQRWAWVIDFKYGRVYVPVVGNQQTRYYSVPLVLDIFSEIDKIGNTIHQPRYYFNDNDHETVWLKPADIESFIHQDLIPSMELAMSNIAPRVPGEWCQYCPAKLDCPELAQDIKYLQPPFPSTNESVAHTVLMKPVLKNLVEDAEIEAADRLMLGELLPGLKPVRSYGRSAIVDPGRCAGELLAAGLTHEQVYENKLRGITALSKHKAALPILKKYKQRGDNGIKAAPMSSTKPAVAIPTQCFSQG